MKDPELLSIAHARANEEKKATLAVLHCLREIEHRGLHLARGFQSLHDFATRELGYSAAAAQRRIQAMRLLREIPEVETKIEQGHITLDSAARAQGFFKQEQKAAKRFSLEEKREILSRLEGKSSRQCERVLAALSSQPEAFLRPDRVAPIGMASVEIRFVAEESLIEDLNRLRELLSNKNPSMKMAELIAELAKIALVKLDPEDSRKHGSPKSRTRRTGHSAPPSASQSSSPPPAALHSGSSKLTPAPAPDSQTTSRYIPIKIRREVLQRDGYRCAYLDPLTGRRCGSRFQLELDHWQVPFAKGGENSARNLKTTCRHHNQWLAIRTYGAAKMASKTPSKISFGISRLRKKNP